ncbi:MAG TPA: SdiA-regulated domain-containing protein [Ferruginibacter sp.]|nr:SdiA-regulated domain-containing protein [Ferruginibacter sp.]
MKTTILIAVIILLTGFILRKDIVTIIDGTDTNGIEEKKGKKDEGHKYSQALSEDISIVQKWDLPEELLEVSAIAYFDKDRFACVQDEKGTIFIFNKTSGNIEKEISFSGAGDFEGIGLNGSTAYIVRSDATIYEVDMNTGKSTEYKTFLSVKNDVESLCYDAKNNRLLIAGKAPDAAFAGFKCIYAFDLSTKTLLKEPVFKLNLENALLSNGKSKKNKRFSAAAIGINPVTNDMYLTDATTSKLLVTDLSGNIKKLYELGRDFAQPEGITFSPQGTLYISNEGRKIPGNIMQVQIK